jgi:hypothetical protein
MAYVILVGIHCFCVEAFFTLLLILFHMFADPYVTVKTQYEVNTAR